MPGEPTQSRIVVGVDGSAASDAAVRWAVRESAVRKLPVTLLHVVAPSPIDSAMAPNGTIPQARLDQAREVVDHAREVAAEPTDRRLICVHGEIAYASVASTLIAASKDANMIVTGSRGVDASSAYRLGSVDIMAKFTLEVLLREEEGHRPSRATSPFWSLPMR
jgi:nucleotide-binding universal stress UspA family protein